MDIRETKFRVKFVETLFHKVHQKGKQTQEISADFRDLTILNK